CRGHYRHKSKQETQTQKRPRCKCAARQFTDHPSPGGRLGHVVGEGFAGPSLRAQGSSGEDGACARCARGWVDRFRCVLQPGPAAAGRFRVSAGVWGMSWVRASRGRACARREARARMGLSRGARGGGWIASDACSGPVPLPLGGSVFRRAFWGESQGDSWATEGLRSQGGGDLRSASNPGPRQPGFQGVVTWMEGSQWPVRRSLQRSG
ncbi:MAG: hypothetical protein RJB04_646, partial [Verrucomicrobiota bacterium]